MAPNTYYENNLETLSSQISKVKKQSLIISMFRLLVFLSMGAMVYFFWGNILVISAALVVGFTVFFFLVSRYTDHKNHLKYLNKLKSINEVELNALAGNLEGLKTGKEYIFEEHHYNQDIDLFGEGSLFQIINRTEIKNGEKQLAAWLNSNDIDTIQKKQQANREIGAKPEWRQDYSTKAGLIESEMDPEILLNWVHNYKPFVPQIFKWLPIAFSIASLVIIGLYWFDVMSWIPLLFWLFVGLGITGKYLKKITDLYNTTSKVDDILAQYSKLLLLVENEKFDSELLKEWQENIRTKGTKASELLSDLSKEINLLANRNNMIFAPVANGFLLWDLRYSYRIEHWLKKFDGALHQWFQVIEAFDTINSMGNFCFNHPDYIYPELTSDSSQQLTAKEIGHPLLKKEAMVTNSIEINTSDFFIITGANMAGKSTFLRTIAVNLVMANCGLPVCAESFQYRPIKLISSMRTSDSLMNDESYFFSELKRLKFIVESIKTDTYFIILDEILKGTNSKDKAEGSQKFVEKLVASNSTGLIATHDLSLCTLEDKLTQIRNYYFDAEIIDDELHFDYRFKKGVCQNMNASFLLRKMEIV